MWNQNSDNKKDGSVAETAHNIVDHEKIVVATSSPSSSSISGGNGKTTKTSRSSGGGGGETNNFDHCSTSKDKDNNYTDSGIVDSGFLSGPQVSEDDYGADTQPRNNTRSNPLDQHHQQNQFKQDKQQVCENLDSGIIEEGDFDEIEQQHQEQLLRSSQQQPLITTTAASPQQRGGLQQQLQQTNDKQMILDNGVDTGLDQWFCKLTLSNPNQQVNNLGAGGNNGSNSGGESASWEIYYQQNDEGDTQLHLACMAGYVEVVAALIRMAPHPCLFNIQNDEAQTSLHLAVIYGQPKILRMLLIAGAEPTARDRNGNTPLHLACISGDTQCVKALTIPISASEIHEAHRSYGHLSSDKTTSYLECARLPADLEIRNYDGERCVHLAAQGGHIDILKDLVWFGADINAREGKSGRTPLHIAIEGCNQILANFLLEECSTLNIETATYAGLTAYQVACILDNRNMQNHLEKNGAQILTPPDSDYDSSDIESDLDDSQMYNRFGDPHYFANYNGGGNPINVA